ncbi:MAG: YebC/PmpR family DNA-binding transcriptional regulator [Candidatus Pacebacteria bacterium]|nr:YebC/PmpR family DNA-binding transcriptional regulator [Candidatus Paceibacterota bacterium]
MSGHNKWSKIKHKKAATDAAKSKIFGKMARLIAIESKKANGDTSSAGLRAAIDSAKAVSMPKDNIDRAVAKGSSEESVALESMLYEMYGPGGTAVLIEIVTDNRNRTGAEIRHMLSKLGYELATPGSAAWAFTKSANIADGWDANSTVEISGEDGTKLEALMEALDEHDDVQDVYTNAA